MRRKQEALQGATTEGRKHSKTEERRPWCSLQQTNKQVWAESGTQAGQQLSFCMNCHCADGHWHLVSLVAGRWPRVPGHWPLVPGPDDKVRGGQGPMQLNVVGWLAALHHASGPSLVTDRWSGFFVVRGFLLIPREVTKSMLCDFPRCIKFLDAEVAWSTLAYTWMSMSFPKTLLIMAANV